MRRRAIVTATLIVSLGALAMRVWPAAAPDARRASSPPPSGTLLPFDPQLAPGAEDGCPGDMLRALRQHPHWTIRVDAAFYRMCGNEPHRREATIAITADGARWQRDGRDRFDDAPWRGEPIPESVELSAAQRGEVLAALESSCAYDDDLPVRTAISIAIDPAADPVLRLERSLASTRIAQVFADVDAQYVGARAPAARGLALALTWRGHGAYDDAMIRRTVTIRAGRLAEPERAERDLDDRELVLALDCALHLPHDRDPVVTGAFTADGVRVPLAISRATAVRATCLHALFELPDDPDAYAPAPRATSTARARDAAAPPA